MLWYFGPLSVPLDVEYLYNDDLCSVGLQLMCVFVDLLKQLFLSNAGTDTFNVVCRSFVSTRYIRGDKPTASAIISVFQWFT